MPQDRTDLPVNETVDVKLRSAVVVTNQPLVVRLNGEDVVVPAGVAGEVDIDVVAPASWPPQMGDVWTGGGGGKWFGVQITDPDGAKVKLQSEEGGAPLSPQAVKTANRPLTLSFRES